MTSCRSKARRPAFVHYALVAALLAFAAYMGAITSCDDRIPGVILLPACALQLLIGLVSLVGAAVAAWRGDGRKALAEGRVGIVVLLSIPATGWVFTELLSRSCECCA